jgi:hypothetical protein
MRKFFYMMYLISTIVAGITLTSIGYSVSSYQWWIVIACVSCAYAGGVLMSLHQLTEKE